MGLLWNLLEARPLLEAHTKDPNSVLVAWHSQILKRRQKLAAPIDAANTSGEGQNGDDKNDVKYMQRSERSDEMVHMQKWVVVNSKQQGWKGLW